MNGSKTRVNRMLRWLTLVAILANIAFSYFYTFFADVKSISEISYSYPAYLTPSGFTFSIWGLIYFAFVIYGIVQVSPSQMKYSIFDKLSYPMIIINIFFSVWIVLYVNLMMLWSVVILAATLVIAYTAFRKAYLAVRYSNNYNLWLQFPFSLMAGWLTVALAANTMVFFQYIGYVPEIGLGTATILAIVLLTAIAFAISVKTYSLVYPATVAWGFFGVSIARQHENPKIAGVAFASVMILLIGTFFVSVFRKVKIDKPMRHPTRL